MIFPAFIAWIGAEKALMPANRPRLLRMDPSDGPADEAVGAAGGKRRADRRGNVRQGRAVG
jgi:hypothetical protein